MIVGDPVDVVVQRVQRGGGDDPRLAHRASEEVLATSSVRHQLRGTGDQRSERTAEALREAERDGVETASDARRLDSARDRGVDEARTVQMHDEVVLAAR